MKNPIFNIEFRKQSACYSIRTINIYGYLVLFLGLSTQLFLLETTPYNSYLVGDEHYYVNKAVNFKTTGRFPKIIEHGDSDAPTWSDYRTPGFPYILSLFIKKTPENLTYSNLRRNFAHFQFALVASLIVLLFAVLPKSNLSVFGQSFLAFMISIQPFTFAYTKSMLSDVITSGMIFISFLLFLLFFLSSIPLRSILTFLLGFTILSSTLTIRPEMLAFSLVFGLLPLVLKPITWKQKFLLLLLAMLPYSLFAAINIDYRQSVAGEFRVYGEFKHPSHGFARWVQTWYPGEKKYLDFVWRIYVNKLTHSEIPDDVYKDESERTDVEILFNRMATNGYSKSIDQVFSRLADQRISENWIDYLALPIVRGTSELLINTETNSQLLNYLSDKPRPLRRSIIGSLLLLKFIFVILMLASVLVLFFRWRNGSIGDSERFLTLLLIFIFARVFFNIPLMFVTDGLAAFSGTYVVPAWLPIAWCAGYTINVLFGWFSNRHWPKQGMEENLRS